MQRLCVLEFGLTRLHVAFQHGLAGVFNHVPRLILFSLVGCLIMTGLLFRSVACLHNLPQLAMLMLVEKKALQPEVMVAVRGLVTIVFTLAAVVAKLFYFDPWSSCSDVTRSDFE